jgi:hypothetical protein
MELHEALRQIDAIRAQVASTETFHGYRAATVAGTGVLALMVAALQPLVVPDPAGEVDRYLALWIAVAAVSATIVALELTWRWLRTDSPLARGQTLRAVEQFAPCLVAGAAATWALARHVPEAAAALPGVWAILFSLGVFASWRQLTPLALGVAGYYLVAGTLCIVLARDEYAFSSWGMALTFGVGQLLSASALYWGLEGQYGEA